MPLDWSHWLMIGIKQFFMTIFVVAAKPEDNCSLIYNFVSDRGLARVAAWTANVGIRLLLVSNFDRLGMSIRHWGSNCRNLFPSFRVSVLQSQKKMLI